MGLEPATSESLVRDLTTMPPSWVKYIICVQLSWLLLIIAVVVIIIALFKWCLWPRPRNVENVVNKSIKVERIKVENRRKVMLLMLMCVVRRGWGCVSMVVISNITLHSLLMTSNSWGKIVKLYVSRAEFYVESWKLISDNFYCTSAMLLVICYQ